MKNLLSLNAQTRLCVDGTEIKFQMFTDEAFHHHRARSLSALRMMCRDSMSKHQKKKKRAREAATKNSQKFPILTLTPNNRQHFFQVIKIILCFRKKRRSEDVRELTQFSRRCRRSANRMNALRYHRK